MFPVALDDPEAEEKKVFVRLVLKLKEFDERLMTDAVRTMSRCESNITRLST